MVSSRSSSPVAVATTRTLRSWTRRVTTPELSILSWRTRSWVSRSRAPVVGRLSGGCGRSRPGLLGGAVSGVAGAGYRSRRTCRAAVGVVRRCSAGSVGEAGAPRSVTAYRKLVAAGVDVRTVAGRLGQSGGGTTTLRVYADWVVAADQRAATTMAGIMPIPVATPRGPRGAYEVIAAAFRHKIATGQLWSDVLRT